MNTFKKIIQFIVILPKLAALLLINIYQHTLSPDHSWLKAKFPYGYCRHFPTCSEYSKQAITKFGLIKGGFMSAKRIAKCNPFAEPSIDLIISNF